MRRRYAPPPGGAPWPAVGSVRGRTRGRRSAAAGSRGAFGEAAPALLGQGLSKRPPLMSDTSARRSRTPDSMEQACVLCHRTEAAPDICGLKWNYEWGYAHGFCLLFASDLHPQGTEEEEEIGFSLMDVLLTVNQAAQMVCFVCGERGATVTCQEMGCDRRFHLPCAVEGGCITRYFLPFSSFCWEHRPQQQELAAPEDTNCLICRDPVEGRTTYGTMVCPACKHAWFHRACIQVAVVPLLRARQPLSSTGASLTLFLFLLQGQAMRAGAFCLRCPLCQNTKLFLTEMLLMGIQIPIRLVSSWPALCHAWTCPRSCGPLLTPKSRL
ncbi:G2/M phase-specific E3 ubiquitin-protein ligase-like [Pezoporus flaviventris]|uniref:G2/M phase-specific E3 ubiquitin-protein ligase-like n=1 Tax=Pezoporus flaviventris TaxID=889875 RepID=UPI002AB1A6E0|nr:G2/M phase-specific E3 ubiquitin-protein ligase-like [Pezoporus flaviventris]